MVAATVAATPGRTEDGASDPLMDSPTSHDAFAGCVYPPLAVRSEAAAVFAWRGGGPRVAGELGTSKQHPGAVI